MFNRLILSLTCSAIAALPIMALGHLFMGNERRQDETYRKNRELLNDMFRKLEKA